MDNLEAQTYETFEKDTVKYIQVFLLLEIMVHLEYFYILRLKKRVHFHRNVFFFV